MFGEFFVQKIKSVHQSISPTPLPPVHISSAVPSTLAVFEVVTVEYVTKLIAASPNKSCDLDPIATSLVKQEAELLAPLINTIVNEEETQLCQWSENYI